MRLCLILLLYISFAFAWRSRGGSKSGTGGSHSYPKSTGYSGASYSGSHTYPQSSVNRYGGSHSYPSSGNSYGGSHSYPSSGNSYGGSHSYPQSNGLSGSSNTGYNNRQNTVKSYSKTEVHHHYHYTPPPRISYGSSNYPVYHGSPPVYIYEYRNSGSRFDTLLTGLALYNLGRMSANSHGYDSHREYRGVPGETCKMGIHKKTGEYEETRIDCKLMSSFIWDSDSRSSEQNQQQVQTQQSNTMTVVTNTNSNNNGTNTVTTVTKTEVVTDALQVKGPSIAVTPDMTCYMIRVSRDNTMKKKVECGVLQQYALSSMRRNNSERVRSMMTIILSFVVYLTFNQLTNEL